MGVQPQTARNWRPKLEAEWYPTSRPISSTGLEVPQQQRTGGGNPHPVEVLLGRQPHRLLEPFPQGGGMQVKAAGQTFHGQVVPVFPADGLDNWGEALQIGTAGGHGGFLPRLPAKPRVTQKQGGQQAAGAVLPLLPSLLQLGSGLPRQIDQPMIRRQAGAGRRAVPRQAGQSAVSPPNSPCARKVMNSQRLAGSPMLQALWSWPG